MHYSNLFYIPYEEIDEDFIYDNLTVYGKQYQGSKIREAFEDTGWSYGVPIYWALQQKFSKKVAKNQTKYPKKKWPKFDFKPRHNQKEVLAAVLKNLKADLAAMFVCPTSWGKTVTALKIAQQMGTKTIVIAHKEDLLDQWTKEAMKFLGIECGRVQGDIYSTSSLLTVATVQTLQRRLDVLPEKFWKEFGLVIADEGHRVACDTFQDVISKFHARYKVTMTATPRRSDGMQKLWELHFGPVIATGIKTDTTLVPHYQAPIINCGLTDGAFCDYKGDISHAKMLTMIAENATYNAYLADFIQQIVDDMDRRVIVCTDRKIQMENLETLLNDRGYAGDVGIYCGGKYKNKIIKGPDLIDASHKKILLATYKKIGEGIDLPQYDTMIIATPKTDSEQAVGRVGRDENGKDPLIIHPIINTGYCRNLFRKCVRTTYAPLKFVLIE